MKVLVIAPWAPNAMRPRSAGLIAALARRHDVHLLHASWNAADVADADALGIRSITAVPLSKWPAITRALISIVRGRSLQAAYVDAPRLRRAVEAAWATGSFDVLYLNVFRTLQYADVAPPMSAVVDMDELRSAYYRQLAERGGRLQRLVARVEAPRMETVERSVLRDTLTLFSNAADAAAAPFGRVVRSTYAFRNDAPATPRDPRSVLFVGRLSYAANVDALRWFVAEVMPLLRDRGAGVRLDVVGAGARPALVRFLRRHGDGDVVLHGEVPDVRPYYDAARVSIVPVRFATGVQMKLIESFARRAPVVCTPLVAQLAGVQHGVHCLVAEAPADWADVVHRLVQDDRLATQLAESGARWVTDEFAPEAVQAQLDEALSALDGGSRARSR